MAKDILLITPPFTQLNTPYPATPFLKGFLTSQDFEVVQADLSIETILSIFSAEGLKNIFETAEKSAPPMNATSIRMLQLKNEYISTIDSVISFLQGKDLSLATSITQNYLPRGKRFESLPDMDWLFGNGGIADKAKYLATLYLEDIGDFISTNIDSHFGFSRYAEKLCSYIPYFDDLEADIHHSTIISETMIGLLQKHIETHQPKVIALSVPFPGNLLAALQMAKFIKQNYSHITITMGGGFVNTELRSLNENRLFNYVDYVTLDDGERPLLQLLNHLIRNEEPKLVRTFVREENEVQYINEPLPEIPHAEIGTPDYSDLPLNNYFSILEVVNPMHRLWSDGRWNKMMIAHGCYWHQCSFCDVTLDYIRRYSKTSASDLCDRVEKVIAQTNQRGFHFVDEAAPPQVLKEFALELIRRNLKITWWTNIRFEKTYTEGLCKLLAASGCIAVSGGLEIASDRLLELIKKGVTIEQVARVTNYFQQAGIMVHAYLMYGFPTQSTQETIDSLEVVRQLFMHGLVQSGFWHRFAMTVHSPVGKNPEEYSIQDYDDISHHFSQNECPFEDHIGTDHGLFGDGLRKSLYNYMHDMCFDFPLEEWFDFNVPHTTISPNRIADAIRFRPMLSEKQQILWLGNIPSTALGKKKKVRLFLPTKRETIRIEVPKNEADFIIDLLEKSSVLNDQKITVAAIEEQCRALTGKSFEKFIKSKSMKVILRNGLAIL
ncbi:radical SAM protein [Prolixibacteraceae bacterium JC049]|nr:radical SAM protein [Prolixibacteraceae bacterium JC049]